MTFQSPWLLLGLVLLPLLVAAYVASERRRRRAAAAFAAPATSASVVPRRPGWRRHVPLALAGLATAALIAALARPQVSVAVPAEQATIVLAMDHSGSMAATDVSPSRLTAALDAGEAFLDKVPKRVRVGGVVFDNRAEAVQSPTTDRAALRDALQAAMKPSGGTATGDALATALEMVRHRRARRRRARSCCSPTARRPTAATRCRSPTRPRSSASRSTPSRSAPPPARCPTATPCRRTRRRCEQIAERSGGTASTASEASKLSAVYEKLGSEVAMKKEQREVTAGFAGGAAILLLLGGGLSLRWFRRLALIWSYSPGA